MAEDFVENFELFLVFDEEHHPNQGNDDDISWWLRTNQEAMIGSVAIFWKLANNNFII